MLDYLKKEINNAIKRKFKTEKDGQSMQKLTTLTLIAMLLIISCAVIFGQPKQEMDIMTATA